MYYYVLQCLMESVTIKIEKSLSDRINKSMNVKGYSTKTEFIREAIRDKLERDEKNILIKELIGFKGKSSIKTSDIQNKKVRDEVAKEIARELAINI
jgi:metal-responsive CopG/Arc/MetJ family transcriptional regulator